MHKARITVTIDMDIAVRLRAENKNVSGLVNEFLRNVITAEQELPTDILFIKDELDQLAKTQRETNLLIAQKSAMLATALEKKERDKKQEMEKIFLMDKAMKLNNPLRYM